MKFTQIPQDTFKELVLNAGVLLSAFSPDTAEVADGTIIGVAAKVNPPLVAPIIVPSAKILTTAPKTRRS